MLQDTCAGTVAANYITDGWYQLDDSETNEAVDSSRFLEEHLTDGNILEVAMQVQRVGAQDELNVCPRCAHRHQDEESTHNGWIRWSVPSLLLHSHLNALR
jgi:hypothetical protein